MKTVIATLLSAITIPAFAAGTMTIQNLPNAPEEPNPVCRDANGTLANCTPTAGVDSKFLSPIAVDGGENVLGTYLGNATVIPTRNGVTIQTVRAQILTDQGYVFNVDRFTGVMPIYERGSYGIGYIYFDELNCEGTGYVHSVHAQNFWQPSGVYNFYDYATFYFPNDSQLVPSVTTVSFRQDESCGNQINNLSNVVPVLANDPAVTGVPNMGTSDNPFSLPIKLERP